MLAVMDVCVTSLLLFHRDGSCICAGRKKCEELNQVRRNWTSAVVRMLAIVTTRGASVSTTLLDLVFRVRVAEHYTSQAQRIHFMGSLQGLRHLPTVRYPKGTTPRHYIFMCIVDALRVELRPLT
jgi:hypothetical protein